MSQEKGHLQEIPSTFYSFDTELPFTHCIECDCELIESGREYMIEKAIRTYPGYQATDVIFDYAICMSCALDIQQSLSEESLKTMQKFISENMSHRAPSGLTVTEMLENCMVSGLPKAECEEFQIFAFCSGAYLDMRVTPYMISGQVLDQMQELLSVETKDELNGFFDKHFSPSPGLMEEPKFYLV